MATEYKLSYTAAEIDERLGKVDTIMPLPLVTELPTNAKYGDICRFKKKEIDVDCGGKMLYLNYDWLDSILVEDSGNLFDERSYSLRLYTNEERYTSWLSIDILTQFNEEINIRVTQNKDEYGEDYVLWDMTFNVNADGHFELSTEGNDVGYQKSYMYDSTKKIQTPLWTVLDGVQIPNEKIYDVGVEKSDNFTFDVFTLEPVLMMFGGSWQAVANESALYQQQGALISSCKEMEKIDGKKYLRLTLDWGDDVDSMASKFIDIPISSSKNVTENSGDITLNGSELDLGVSSDGLPVAYINEDGELIFEIGGDVTDAWLNERGELEVELS